MLTLQDEIKTEIKYYIDKIIDAQAILDSALTLNSDAVGKVYKEKLVESARTILHAVEDQLYRHIALIAKKEYITGNLI